MKIIFTGFVSAVLTLTAVMSAQSTTTPARPSSNRSIHDQKSETAPQDPGERSFQSHCSRCHTAPEELSPRITGTIVRHMRVRANLSAEDERLIRHYLAP